MSKATSTIAGVMPWNTDLENEVDPMWELASQLPHLMGV